MTHLTELLCAGEEEFMGHVDAEPGLVGVLAPVPYGHNHHHVFLGANEQRLHVPNQPLKIFFLVLEYE